MTTTLFTHLPVEINAPQAFAILTTLGTFYTASQLAAYWRVDEGSSYLKTLTGNGWMAIVWALFGFSIAYGPSQTSRVIGNARWATIDEFLGNNQSGQGATNGYDASIFWCYSVTLVLLANAILSSVSARMSWGNYIVFGTLWTLGSYVPLTHWIFGPAYRNPQNGKPILGGNMAISATTGTRELEGGWLGSVLGSTYVYGLRDFAGVHPIHINAGVSALVLTYWMRHHDSVEHAHNVWDVLPSLAFGWLFYVIGAPYAANAGYANAAGALVNTLLAGFGGAFTWAALEWIIADSHLEVAGGWRKLFTGSPSATGAVTGYMSGIVSITAAGGWVSPMWAIFFGFFTALVVFFGPTLVSRYLPNFSWAAKQNYSAFMVHAVAGAVGSALTGLFANASFQAGGKTVDTEKSDPTVIGFNGAFYFNAAQLGRQCAGITITIAVAVVVTTVSYWFTFWLGRLAFYPQQTGLSEAEQGDEKL